VTGGSLVVTQNLEHVALELKHIRFSIADATFTNVFQVAHQRQYRIPQTQTTRIYTNEFDSTDLTTNLVFYTATATNYTDTVTIATTTNSTAVQIYDGSNFGYGWTFGFEDISTFSFTYTGTINLVRVYDEYPRP